MATQKEVRHKQREEPKEASKESEIKQSVSSTTTTTSEPHHHEHVHIHGVSSKGHYIVDDHANDGPGDRADGCHATSKADHFKCVH
ncbi:hypothetical protein PanWU01x14_299540 [Parasponia andersonii]|uniref:Uncharacterized protein n=1 Tax=Parasponia andersonii TaxID=3476 RepID=A0A2P5AU74_PARAD|nr:hypothetical protein PanWU01x14_299540 [Parasponia andersonii]